jgi:hypothetical protein
MWTTARREVQVAYVVVSIVLRAGVAFADEQLTERGWFSTPTRRRGSSSAAANGSRDGPGRKLVDFRPTFELVTRHLYHELSPHIPQLAFVELRDHTFATTTRYSPATAGRERGARGWLSMSTQAARAPRRSVATRRSCARAEAIENRGAPDPPNTVGGMITIVPIASTSAVSTSRGR